MIVMKFGGSSVANAECIRNIASIIKVYAEKRPIVVLSAMGDTTDHLLEAAENAFDGRVDISRIEKLHMDTAKDLALDEPSVATITELLQELKTLLTGISMLKELTRRTRDYLVSFGERLSVRMVAAYLSKEGTPARFCDGWDVGFTSDSNFMEAELLDSVWDDIPAAFADYKSGKKPEIPVVTGFIAKNKAGYITTLGRGGSDLTATMIGAALRVEEVQTWKDVDGILTADPSLVPNARTVFNATYEEAAELAYFGAQILHPRSMAPCRKTGTPVRVKNSYNIDFAGSLITEKHDQNPESVRAITSVNKVTLIEIVSTRMLGASGFMAHIFNLFLKWKISIDVIATSEVSLSLTANTKIDLTGLVADLSDVAEIHVKPSKAIITIICDAARSSHIIATGFAALDAQNINPDMISQGASKVNISLVCDDADTEKVMKTLHKAYFGE